MAQAAAAPLVGLGPAGWIMIGGITLGTILLANKQGGSGEWRRHDKLYPSRKRAYDAAQRGGGGRPPIKHPGHFHASDKDGEKVKGSHYSY